jgi:hypothetical protein
MTISYPGLMTREGVPILYHIGGGATIGAIRLVLMYLCPNRRGVRSHARGSPRGWLLGALAGWPPSRVSHPAGAECGLGTKADLEFLEDVGHVDPHGLDARPEAGRDLGIVRTLSDESEDLRFTRSEVDPITRRSAENARRSAGSDDRAAGRDGAECCEHLLLPCTLQHLAARADTQSRGHRIVVVDHREHQDAHRVMRQDAPDGLHPGDTGEVEVHHDDVGCEFHGGPDGALPVADDIDAWIPPLTTTSRSSSSDLGRPARTSLRMASTASVSAARAGPRPS